MLLFTPLQTDVNHPTPACCLSRGEREAILVKTRSSEFSSCKLEGLLYEDYSNVLTHTGTAEPAAPAGG